MLPKSIEGLSDVFTAYDGFILDLWGVVHDGIRPFPGTLPALQNLKKVKKKVWFLSNAPQRAAQVADKMHRMGVTPDLYTGIVTSGEVAWEAMRDRLVEQWGRRCLYLGGSDTQLFEGIDVKAVREPAQADFMLVSDQVNLGDDMNVYRPLLQACAEKKLPMICANPDRTVHVGNTLLYCAGALADLYAELEGEVVYFGKPYRGVYRRCLQEMGVEKVLAVGDSMLTDIAGATGSGLDCVLVTSGIHREEFLLSGAKGHLEAFFARYPYRPTYIMPAFDW